MANRIISKMHLNYDREADALHVTFGTGEPSFCEEVDDHLIVEYGFFSGAPTGFQLLHVREAGIKRIGVELKQTWKKVRSRERSAITRLASERSQLFRRAIREAERRARKLV